MSTNDKKDKNEELFDHIIEYGAGRWTDEISPDNIPEEELSDQLNQKIDTIFSSARKRANPDFVFNYIPAGYHFSKKTVAKNGTFFIYEYKDKKKNYLYIQINFDTTFESYTNIDKTEYTKFIYKNTEYYYLPNEVNQLIWYKNKCIYKVFSKHKKTELLKIATGIKY